MKEIILAKYGEIILKGGNRPKFENILMNNIRNSLKNVAEVKARLAQATIYVEVFDEDKMDIVVERLSKIFGIVSGIMNVNDYIRIFVVKITADFHTNLR